MQHVYQLHTYIELDVQFSSKNESKTLLSIRLKIETDQWKFCFDDYQTLKEITLQYVLCKCEFWRLPHPLGITPTLHITLRVQCGSGSLQLFGSSLCQASSTTDNVFREEQHPDRAACQRGHQEAFSKAKMWCTKATSLTHADLLYLGFWKGLHVKLNTASHRGFLSEV